MEALIILMNNASKMVRGCHFISLTNPPQILFSNATKIH